MFRHVDIRCRPYNKKYVYLKSSYGLSVCKSPAPTTQKYIDADISLCNDVVSVWITHCHIENDVHKGTTIQQPDPPMDCSPTLFYRCGIDFLILFSSPTFYVVKRIGVVVPLEILLKADASVFQLGNFSANSVPIAMAIG